MMEMYYSGRSGKTFKPKPKFDLNPKWKADLISKGELERLYLQEHLGIRTIATKLHIDYKSVKARLIYYNIPIRSYKEAIKFRSYPTGHPSRRKASAQDILNLINVGLTKNQIANQLNICEKAVYFILKKADIYENVKSLIKLNAIKQNVKPHGYFSNQLGHKVRSSWEEKFGLILSVANLDYKYEPFLLPVTSGSYLPDFKVGRIILEVKGYPCNNFDILKEVKHDYPEYSFWLIRGDGQAVNLVSLFDRDYILFNWRGEVKKEVEQRLLCDLRSYDD